MPIQRITSGILANGAVVATDIADGSITTAKIADGNVTAAKVSTIANTQLTGTITSAQLGTGAVEQYFADTGYQAQFRNRIINGDMRIDQRNAGASVTVNGAATYITDRFIVQDFCDAVLSAQQVSDAPAGFVNSLKVTVTTADASLGATQGARVNQRIEGYNIADLGWGTANAKTVTLSFWVKSSLTGTFGGSLQTETGLRAYPFTYTISVADTWEYKTITVAGDTSGTWNTTNGVGVIVQWGLGMGSTYSGTAGAWASADYLSATGAVSVVGTLNATFFITGVQFEVGSVATPFERRPYGTELALCQRYYWKTLQGSGEPYGVTGYMNAGNAVWTQFCLPVTMRASPTVTVYGTWAVSNTGQPTIRGASASNFLLQIAATGTGIATSYPNSSDDIIDASAEL